MSESIPQPPSPPQPPSAPLPPSPAPAPPPTPALRSQPPPPLTEAVYAQLRAIAQRQMSSERAGHTLQATALVHEAYMRLSQHEKTWGSDGEFYGAAAEAMRRILIEHARKRKAAKRGGPARRADGIPDMTGVVDLATQDDPDLILSLDEAIVRLEEQEPRIASVVRLRFYAGLTAEQAAEALGVSSRTVQRDWDFARAWLLAALRR